MSVYTTIKTARRADDDGGIPVSRRRTWFADDATGAATVSTGTDSTSGATDTGTQSDAPAIPPAIAAQLAQLEKRARDAESQLTKLQKAQSQKEKEAAAAAGNFQELHKQAEAELEQLRPKAQRAETVEQTLKQIVAQRVQQIPQQFRPLVPEYDDPLKVLEWMDKNSASLRNPSAPNLDAGAGNAAGGSGSSALAGKLSEEERQYAERLKITPEAYAKQLAAIRARKQQ